MKIALLALTKNRFTNGIQNTLETYGNDVERIETNPTPEQLGRFDLAISWFWPHILKPAQIDATKYGILNNHIGYLPYGRGACPNVWAIVDNIQAGVTIHWIDAGVDTGDILFQRTVEKRITDTGETLYDFLCQEMSQLFVDKWHYIQASLRDDLPVPIPTRQQVGDHKTYRMKDLEEIDDLEGYFDKSVAREFVDILRARTFASHDAAYIRDDQGRKVYVRVQLSYE